MSVFAAILSRISVLTIAHPVPPNVEQEDTPPAVDPRTTRSRGYGIGQSTRPGPAYHACEWDPNIATGRSVAGNSLLRGFIHGATSYKPKAILIGNDYPGMSWDEASYRVRDYDFELAATGLDHKRMETWVGSLPGKPSVLVKDRADASTIKSIFKSCHTVPTLLYLNGHGEIRAENEHVYYPADCSRPGCFWPTSGIPLTEMGQWLTEKVGAMKIMMITDFCYCTNFLGEITVHGRKGRRGMGLAGNWRGFGPESMA
ncbi:hypothetical protein FRC06_011411 [Ceratobasidium sp. 370]|nr:hypothetical protein FRC06_011411 [Ceratobasidium sp. 370]